MGPEGNLTQMGSPRWPTLTGDPGATPFLPLVMRFSEALLQGHRDAPDAVALLRSDAEAADPTLDFRSRDDAATVLLTLGDELGGEARPALRAIASELVRPRPHRADAFDCIVVTRQGVVMLQLPSVSRQEQGRHAVSLTVAALRGLTPDQAPASGPVGVGYAIRSQACKTCRRWAAALAERGMPLVGRVAPVAPPCPGDTCATCEGELESAARAAASLYDLEPADVGAAAEPESVLAALRWAEDIEKQTR